MNSDRQSIENASWISLADDENVLAWSHPSLFPYLPTVIIGTALILGGLFGPFVLEGNIGLATLLLIPFGLLMFILEYIKYISKFYIFTDRRAITKRGIISHSVRKVRYENIDKKRKKYPIIGRILGYGQLTLVTATPDDSDIDMNFLPEMNSAAELIANNRDNNDGAGDINSKSDRELGN